MPAYRTAPIPSDRMPPGIPYIIGNEAAERFSYYGMRGILAVFMTGYLLARTGEPDLMSETDATKTYHLFLFLNYSFPLLGALIADCFLGKYRTIVILSIVYCLGHLALALDETRVGLYCGLFLIALGAGGIKPCVSAHVGDQFGASNKHLLEKVFGWFYFSINFGAFISTLLTPLLLAKYGPRVAFAVPGILMAIATFVFWLGRNRFVHIPPSGAAFFRDVLSREGLKTLARLSLVYVFVMVFWSLYEQTGSKWVFQAEKMDRVYNLPIGWLPAATQDYLRGLEWLPLRWEVLPAQIGSVNPILILIYMPLFTYVIYPAIHRFFPLTPLRKISIGLFLTVASFVISAWIEHRIDAGEAPDVNWQILAFMILTAAEVMVSITGLEFSYTQAPPRMKSLVMSMFFLSVSMGNLLTFGVNWLGAEQLKGPVYYWFFAGLMLAAAVLFLFVVRFYREKTYIQQEGAAEA